MTEQTTTRREQYRADKALIMAKYTPLLKAMSAADPGYARLWDERARLVRELTEAYEAEVAESNAKALHERFPVGMRVRVGDGTVHHVVKAFDHFGVERIQTTDDGLSWLADSCTPLAE